MMHIAYVCYKNGVANDVITQVKMTIHFTVISFFDERLLGQYNAQ